VNSPFSFLDWLMVVGFLAFCGVLGILVRRRIGSLDDFLVMGRRLGPVWGVATLAATETGLVTIIYFSEEAYLAGFVALSAAVIAASMMWLVGRTGLVIRRLRALQVRTVPEYLEGRFSLNVRWIAGLATFTVGVLNMGIFLQTEGTFLAVVMGISPAKLPIIMGVMLVVVLAYTMLGGMYSVVLTDVVQFFFIIIGVSLTTYFIFSTAGGWEKVLDAVAVHRGSAGFNLWDAPRYGGMFLLWTALYYLSGWSSWQPVVARVLSMRDVKTALRLYRLSSFFMLLRAVFPMLWGIGALAVIGVVTPSSTALPQTLARVLPAGTIGLVTVGFLAASMSTYSSYFLAFSSILVQDVVAPRMRRQLSDRERVVLTQGGILVLGILIYLWGSFYRFPESVFRYITVTGSLSYAATLTVLVGGLYWKRASVAGAYSAFLGSAIPPLVCLARPEFSPTYAGLLSFALAPLGMVAGSALFSRKGQT
jgi:SSS family solute:Na+ symporter